jgi:deoxycytidylate deaminase
MENGLNFEKPLRLLRQAKEWQEQDGTEQECSHTVPAQHILLLQALQKNIGEKETLYLIAHIGL